MAQSICTIRIPGPGPYATKVFINNASGYAATTTSALTVDDTARGTLDVRTIINVNQDVYAKNSANGDNMELVGRCTAAGSATAITFDDGTGLRFALVDNQELYITDPSFMALNLALFSGLAGLPNHHTPSVCWSPRGEICYTFTNYA